METKNKQSYKNIHTIGVRQDNNCLLELDVLQFAHIACFSSVKNTSEELFMSIIQQSREKNQAEVLICNNENEFSTGTFRDHLPEELYSSIEKIYKTMQKRQNLLLTTKVDNFEEYNIKHNSIAMPLQILAIRNWETAWTYLIGFYQNNIIQPNSPLDMLMKILETGRSFGCSVIIMAKEPSDQNIPNQIKNQISVKIINASDQETLIYFGLNKPLFNKLTDKDDCEGFYIKTDSDFVKIQPPKKT